MLPRENIHDTFSWRNSIISEFIWNKTLFNSKTNMMTLFLKFKIHIKFWDKTKSFKSISMLVISYWDLRANSETSRVGVPSPCYAFSRHLFFSQGRHWANSIVLWVKEFLWILPSVLSLGIFTRIYLVFCIQILLSSDICTDNLLLLLFLPVKPLWFPPARPIPHPYTRPRSQSVVPQPGSNTLGFLSPKRIRQT